MSNWMIFLLSYLIGTISPSYIFTKALKNKDIRDYGSGNAGTTNVVRVNGLNMGLAVFVVDFMKGLLVAYFVRENYDMMTALIASIFVILGHIYPVFLKFRGGKGVASSLGILLCLFFKPMVICCVIGLCVLYAKRYVSLAAMVTLFLINVTLILLKTEPRYVACTVIIFLIVTYKHKANINRLLNHEENKLRLKK